MPSLTSTPGIQRPLNDPAYVVIDLDFDTASQAENLLGLLDQIRQAIRIERTLVPPDHGT
jgi:hypothetical protein